MTKNRELEYGIAGPTEQVAAECNRWAQVVDDAVQQFQADRASTRRWVAVIGPAPNQGASLQRTVVTPMRLQSPIKIGPMELSPVDQ